MVLIRWGWPRWRQAAYCILQYCHEWHEAKGLVSRLHVEDEALQGEAEDGGDGVEPDLAIGVYLGLAEGAVVLVVAFQMLRAQQPRLQPQQHIRS